jgi:hypothetical protein
MAACSAVGTVVPTLPPTPTRVSASTPGLLLRGHVRLKDGTGLAGLANVVICRNFASYQGSVVGTTDQTGMYQAGFVGIPGDEMVGVWPLLQGYTFSPATVRWRHYHGYEERTLDFVASASSATDVPPAACR